MAKNDSINNLLAMMDQGVKKAGAYGARGDADMGSRANLDALMGEGKSILAEEATTNARKARLAAIRAKTRGTGATAAAPEATVAKAGSALERVPVARVPASQVQYIPPGAQSSGRVFAMGDGAAAATRPAFAMGGPAAELAAAQPLAIGQGAGGGGLASMAQQASGATAGATPVGNATYTRTAQLLGGQGSPLAGAGQAAAASTDDVARALGAGTRAATTNTATRAAMGSVDDLLMGIGSTADDAARTAAMRNLAAQSAGLTDDIAAQVARNAPALADDVVGAAGAAGKMGRFGAVAGKAVPVIGGYMGGQMLGGVLDKADVGGDNSAWDRFLRNAGVGAGLGAGVGSIVPGIGTVTGALGGALVGGVGAGLLGVKFGDDSTVGDVAQQFSGALAQSGLDPETQNAVMAQFHLQTQGLGASQARQVVQALSQQASQLVIGQQQERAAQQRTMALQSMMAPLLQPYLTQASASNAANQRSLELAASQITDPQLQAIYMAQAGNQRQMADQTIAGYAAQMANPQMANELAQLQQYGSRVNSSILGTLAGQAAQAAAGTGAGGQASLADILANAQRVG
jgi:hypothetical protein